MNEVVTQSIKESISPELLASLMQEDPECPVDLEKTRFDRFFESCAVETESRWLTWLYKNGVRRLLSAGGGSGGSSSVFRCFRRYSAPVNFNPEQMNACLYLMLVEPLAMVQDRMDRRPFAENPETP